MSPEMLYRFVSVSRLADGVVALCFEAGKSHSRYHFHMEEKAFLRMTAALTEAPTEDNEIDALVSALAALTDRVRALEELAKPKAATGELRGRFDVVDLIERERAGRATEIDELRSSLIDEKPRRTS